MPKARQELEGGQPDTYVYEIRNDVKFSDGTPMNHGGRLFCPQIRVMEARHTSSYLGMDLYGFTNVQSSAPTGDWPDHHQA